MPRIAEAYSDENGKARGGELGDQNGREVRVREWYLRKDGWPTYIECTDPILADAAAYNAELFATVEVYGYDQDERWTGYKTAKELGIENGKPSALDCSTHVLASYILAGLDIPAEGYTGNLERILLATGKFVSYKDAAHTDSANIAKRGGMYLAAGNHVMMVLDDGPLAHEEEILPEQPEPEGPALKTEGRVYAKGSVNVRETPIDGKVMTVLHKGESLPLVSPWYAVEVDGEVGYISAKPKYTEVR